MRRRLRALADDLWHGLRAGLRNPITWFAIGAAAWIAFVAILELR